VDLEAGENGGTPAERPVIHPATALRFIDPIVGSGVFATAPIPRGTVTWVLDALDQIVDPEHLEDLGTHWRRWRDHHTFGDRAGRRILCWDLCRSMNHSCRPNCGGTDLGLEVALTDIAAGEELTNDYGTLHIDASEGFPCRCGDPECRGVVGPDGSAATRLHPRIVAALAAAERLEQPLQVLLAADWRERALEELGECVRCVSAAHVPSRAPAPPRGRASGR